MSNFGRSRVLICRNARLTAAFWFLVTWTKRASKRTKKKEIYKNKRVTQHTVSRWLAVVDWTVSSYYVCSTIRMGPNGRFSLSLSESGFLHPRMARNDAQHTLKDAMSRTLSLFFLNHFVVSYNIMYLIRLWFPIILWFFFSRLFDYVDSI